VRRSANRSFCSDASVVSADITCRLPTLKSNSRASKTQLIINDKRAGLRMTRRSYTEEFPTVEAAGEKATELLGCRLETLTPT
jgi:hypothetical protein